jgi:DNA-directed RNA polymerase specialized sigma24 family protein
MADDQPWGVRGVPQELRDRVKARADATGMKVGACVAAALEAYLTRPQGEGLGERVGRVERELVALLDKIDEALAVNSHERRRAKKSPPADNQAQQPRAKKGRNWLTEDERAEIVRLKAEKPDLSQAEIGRRLGRSQGSVSDVLKRAKG